MMSDIDTIVKKYAAKRVEDFNFSATDTEIEKVFKKYSNDYDFIINLEEKLTESGKFLFSLERGKKNKKVWYVDSFPVVMDSLMVTLDKKHFYNYLNMPEDVKAEVMKDDR